MIVIPYIMIIFHSVNWFWFTIWNQSMINLLSLLVIDTLRRREQAVTQLATAQEQGRVVRQELASAQLLA